MRLTDYCQRDQDRMKQSKKLFSTHIQHRLIFVHDLAHFIFDETLARLRDVNDRADVLQKHKSIALNTVQARLKTTAA